MVTQAIAQIIEVVNFTHKQGKTFNRVFDLKERINGATTQNLFDLSGLAGRGHIRFSSDGSLAAQFQVTLDYVPGNRSRIKLYLDAATMRSLAIGTYNYDVELYRVSPDEEIPVMEGTLTITREYTI